MRTWIADLQLSRKFALLGLITALMFLLPATLIVRTDLEKLRVARAELAGLGPARSAIDLIHVTQQHRGLSAVALGGDAGAASARQAKQAEVDEALTALEAALATLGEPSLSTAAGTLTQHWRSLAKAVQDGTVSPAQSIVRHTDIVTGQLALLQDITHATGIVLVPDRGTYFLQAAVLGELPHLTEAFGQARGLGAALLGNGNATQEDRARISHLGGAVTQRFAEARKYFDLALRDDPVTRAALAGALDEAMGAADKGLAALDTHLIRAQNLSYPAAEFYGQVTHAIEAQFALVDVATTALGAALQRHVDTVRNEIVFVLGLGTALAMLATWFMWTVTRVTTGAMSAALAVAEAVAEGDLAVEVPATSRDEAGQVLAALDRMKTNLARIVGSVRGNAEGVATASAQIAQGNQDLSSRTEEQASSLQQTAASMEQLGSTVRLNADNARQANQLAQGASEVARRGGQVVTQVVERMQGIQGSSQKIADIIGTIDGIAFQTNILALNAAVEAARAGEQGRGFAVVAGEVRTLAQRSAEAAREIKRLITTSVEQVESGSALADQAGTTMGEVVSAIRRVTDIMGEISAASAEQSQGVGQVGEAVSQMDQVTQQNAALVEESAAAAESLRLQSRNLVDAVAVFRLARHEAGVGSAAGNVAGSEARAAASGARG